MRAGFSHRSRRARVDGNVVAASITAQ